MNTLNDFKVNADIYLLRFLFIELLNVLIFIYSGIKIRKNKDDTKYWKYAILPIISYAVCKGLRFGRDIDYNLYYHEFALIGKDFWDGSNHEFLFRFFNWSLYQLGLTYQSFILLCSIILILVVMKFIKEHKEIAPLVLIFFLLETTLATNYIRWYLGFSFFFLSYIYLTKNSYKLFFLFLTFSISSHIGIIILYGILLIIKRYNNYFPPKIVFILFLSSLILGEIKLFNFLVPYADVIFSISERTQGYAIKFEDLINGEWRTGYMEIPFSTKIKYLLAYSFPLYYYPIAHKDTNKYNYLPYNLFCIGLILFPIFNIVELFDRYSRALMFFSIIISSAAFYYASINYKFLKKNEKIFYKISFFSACYSIFSFFIGYHPWFKTLFIWDAGELKTLPLWYFRQLYL